jgi:hypothetical protein
MNYSPGQVVVLAPPTALDPVRRRFAVAGPEAILAVQLG